MIGELGIELLAKIINFISCIIFLTQRICGSNRYRLQIRSAATRSIIGALPFGKGLERKFYYIILTIMCYLFDQLNLLDKDVFFVLLMS